MMGLDAMMLVFGILSLKYIDGCINGKKEKKEEEGRKTGVN